MTDLPSLISAVEAAGGPSREIDLARRRLLFGVAALSLSVLPSPAQARGCWRPNGWCRRQQQRDHRALDRIDNFINHRVTPIPAPPFQPITQEPTRRAGSTSLTLIIGAGTLAAGGLAILLAFLHAVKDRQSGESS